MSTQRLVKAFESLKIRGLEIKNRIGMSPMCQYSCFNQDGRVNNDWHYPHYTSRAVGGASLIIVEATAVEPEGRITPFCTGIWNEQHVEDWKPITQSIKSHGCIPVMQIAHSGRKGSSARPWEGAHHLDEKSGGWQTKAPSPIPVDPKLLWKTPKEMTIQDIKETQLKFVEAAKRSVRAGFQAIEIHGAHGYLIHTFNSPLYNKRTDQYGGSFENRTRFLCEIVSMVRQNIPQEMPLFVRLSITEWHDNGWDVDDSVLLAHKLKALGVDLIDCSSGYTASTRKIPYGPGFQVPFAERIRKEVGILTAAVGQITEAEQAEKIISEGKADIVLCGKKLLRDPYFPYHVAEVLSKDQPEKILPVRYSFWLKARIHTILNLNFKNVL